MPWPIGENDAGMLAAVPERTLPPMRSSASSGSFGHGGIEAFYHYLLESLRVTCDERTRRAYTSPANGG